LLKARKDAAWLSTEQATGKLPAATIKATSSRPHHQGRKRMFSHIFVGSNDIERSKKFYDATLGALGVPPGVVDPKGRLFYMTPAGIFGVSKPIDGKGATHANGGTIGFACKDSAQADAWHKAGVAAGGTAIEDPPGVRDNPAGPKLYLAYLRDPDGNKLCALHRM
jgi:catechol 2,3-dioxygenase-like lactoylglutathione lyase family enzyme